MDALCMYKAHMILQSCDCMHFCIIFTEINIGYKKLYVNATETKLHKKIKKLSMSQPTIVVFYLKCYRI